LEGGEGAGEATSTAQTHKEDKGERTKKDEVPLGVMGSFLSGIPLPTNAFECGGGVPI
jgi:hypothetical protein